MYGVCFIRSDKRISLEPFFRTQSLRPPAQGAGRRRLSEAHPDPGARHSGAPASAAIFWASPRPAPARRRRSRCRCSTGFRRHQTRPEPRTCRALVLTPTRELAAQIAESFRTYGRFLKLETAVVFGGTNISPQLRALQGGVDILVATPGRLVDLIERRAVSLGKLEIFVLDEVDQMLDLGFIHAIRRITALLPKNRQNLFFSATMPKEIAGLADALLKEPVRIEIARATTVEEVDQHVIHVEAASKLPLLAALLGRSRPRAHPGVHAHQARRRQGGEGARQSPASRRGDPRQQVAAPARARAPRLQVGQGRRAGGDRHRRARHRHRRRQPRHQLRSAACAGVLRSPHRPHRARRSRRARRSPSARPRSARCCAISSAPSACRCRSWCANCRCGRRPRASVCRRGRRRRQQHRQARPSGHRSNGHPRQENRSPAPAPRVKCEIRPVVDARARRPASRHSSSNREAGLTRSSACAAKPSPLVGESWRGGFLEGDRCNNYLDDRARKTRHTRATRG